MVTNPIEPINGLALFAGVHGIELGLEAALEGYRTVCVVEREADCAGRMAARIKEGSTPELAWWDNVRTFDGKPWRGTVDILTAGFPCQPFSLAGKRGGTADERWLWPDIERIIEESQPLAVFLENVPGLLLDTSDSNVERGLVDDTATDDHGGMGAVLRGLARLGFDAEWDSFTAANMGAAHRRKRVFIFAYSRRIGRGHDSPIHRWRNLDNSKSESRLRLSKRANEKDSESRERERDVDNAHGTRSARALRDARTGWESPNESGSHVVDAAQGRWGERRESSGQVGQPYGPNGAMGNATEPGLPFGGSVDGNRGEERSATERTSRDVAHAARDGRHRPDGEAGGRGRRGTGTPGESMGLGGSITDALGGIFAPGPSDAQWSDVLLRNAWLRPSLAQAETESAFCDVAHGLADLVVSERPDALRAAGNGVVPLQAALAFIVLARRAQMNVNLGGLNDAEILQSYFRHLQGFGAGQQA